MRAITFSFVNQSSSRVLEKFGEDIPTSTDVIGTHTLNFRANFFFIKIIFGYPRPRWGVRYIALVNL